MYTSTTEGNNRNAVQVNKGFVDYIFPNIEAYNADSIQVNNNRVDYLVGNSAFYSEVIVEQSSGWSVNWNLINLDWNIVNVNWET